MVAINASSVYRKLRQKIGRASSQPAASSRVDKAVEARANATNDFFGGWELSDIQFLERYKITATQAPEEGTITDWLGIKTQSRYHAWLGNPKLNMIIGDIPVPDDALHAEAIEYVALFVSLERARLKNAPPSFTMMELGASYAPWATASAVCALRLGFEKVFCTAVEASGPAIQKIKDHASQNGLLPNGKVRFDIINAAVSTDSRTLYFPKLDVNSDNGAQAVSIASETDYRGLNLHYEEVAAVTLSDLTRDSALVDFLHMDLQGFEEKLLGNSEFIQCLDQKVSTLFLATQSRLIEGLALQTLSRLGWELIRERPTSFKPNHRTQDINGWTLRDGGQLWINTRISPAKIVAS